MEGGEGREGGREGRLGLSYVPGNPGTRGGARGTFDETWSPVYVCVCGWEGRGV